MDRDAEIDELHPVRDKPVVFAWLRSHLRWHITAWSRAYGFGWGEREIARHIEERDLVSREWDELSAARDDDGRFVGVARAGRRAVGIVYAETRIDRYLTLPVGVVSWLFVEPLSRGSGVAGLLLAATRTWMTGRGLPAAELMVTAENLAAVKAYGKAGYEVIDHRMIARLGPPGGADGLAGSVGAALANVAQEPTVARGQPDDDEGQGGDSEDDGGEDDGVDWIDEPV